MANNLRAIRDALALTLADVAAQLGVKAASLHRWEVGKVPPNLARLECLARIYDVSVEDLVREHYVPRCTKKVLIP